MRSLKKKDPETILKLVQGDKKEKSGNFYFALTYLPKLLFLYLRIALVNN